MNITTCSYALKSVCVVVSIQLSDSDTLSVEVSGQVTLFFPIPLNIFPSSRETIVTSWVSHCRTQKRTFRVVDPGGHRTSSHVHHTNVNSSIIQGISCTKDDVKVERDN